MFDGSVDRMVEAWLLCEFRLIRPDHHLSSCLTAYATLQPETGWDCGCYSDYTRDDIFSLAYTVACEHGEIEKNYKTPPYKSPTDIYEKLDAFMENEDCPYEGEWDE